MLGMGYGTSGRREDAEKILVKLRESRAQRFTPAYSLALVCVGLGDHEQAINWLEESYRERDGNNIVGILSGIRSGTIPSSSSYSTARNKSGLTSNSR